MGRKSFKEVTGLRGVFALVIFLYHTLPETPLVDAIPLTSWIRGYGGTIGNYMFFTLSGFLIAHGYYERINRHEVTFGDFLVKRLAKLYPLYLITNFAALIVKVIQYGPSVIKIREIVLMLLLQLGGGLEVTEPYNGPTWFLSALFSCYILFYFIAYHAKHHTQYCCMIVAALIWGYTTEVYAWFEMIPFARGIAYMGFFVGCVLAAVYPRLPENVHRWLRPVSITSLLLAVYLMARYGVEIICGDIKASFALFFCPLILYVALENRLFAWFLRSKPMQLIGKMSMSIYFWQYVVHILFNYLNSVLYGNAEMGNGAYLVFLAVMTVCTVLSYFFIEGNGRIAGRSGKQS